MKLLTLIAAALLSQPGPSAQPPATGTLLVGNKGENTISFIDLATGRELGRSATGPMPHEIAVSPDGRRAAVVAYGGRTIDIFDVATRTRAHEIDLRPNAGPHGIVWLPDGRIIATTERSKSLSIVDMSGPRPVVTQVATGQDGTHMVVASPDGRRAYTANIQSGSLSVIDLETSRLFRNVRIGGTPEAIAISPDGRTLWVGDNQGARVLAFDASRIGQASGNGGAVNVTFEVAQGTAPELRRVGEAITRALQSLPGAGAAASMIGEGSGWVQVPLAAPQPADALGQMAADAVRRVSAAFPQGRTEISFRILEEAPLATVRTGPVPIRVLASPDGRWIVTSNAGDGTLTVIDAATRKVERSISVSGAREAVQVTILFSQDGRRLYAAETGRNQVAEVDMASGQVLRRFAAGRRGDGLAIAPAAR